MSDAEQSSTPEPVAESEVAATLTEVAATHHGRIMGAVIAAVRDWQVAEDSVQDAYERAITAWSRDGIPTNPAGWIVTTAQRRSIDRFRRSQRHDAAIERYAAAVERGLIGDSPVTGETPATDVDVVGENSAQGGDAIPDDRLRLIFTCAHPALPLASRVALTLRTVLGFDVARIAALLTATEPATQKRLVRARAKIAHAGIPYRIPSAHDLPDRLRGVLAVVYLLFTTGYNGPDDAAHSQLCVEAIRLARLVSDLLEADDVNRYEADGLLGLLLVQQSRQRARIDPSGRRILIDDQDRRLWDRTLVEEAERTLERVTQRAAHRRQPVGTYTLQAAIALEHARPDDPDLTDWTRIVMLHRVLGRIDPSPHQQVAAAIATGHADHADAGLAELDSAHDARPLWSWHAARGHLLERLERHEDAAAAYERASERVDGDIERAQLRDKATCLRALADLPTQCRGRG